MGAVVVTIQRELLRRRWAVAFEIVALLTTSASIRHADDMSIFSARSARLPGAGQQRADYAAHYDIDIKSLIFAVVAYAACHDLHGY